MTTNQPVRLDQLQALLADFIAASTGDRQASNERMTRLEEAASVASARMERVERIVESNNLVQRQDKQKSHIKLGRIQRTVDAIAQHLGLDDS